MSGAGLLRHGVRILRHPGVDEGVGDRPPHRRTVRGRQGRQSGGVATARLVTLLHLFGCECGFPSMQPPSESWGEHPFLLASLTSSGAPVGLNQRFRGNSGTDSQRRQPFGTPSKTP